MKKILIFLMILSFTAWVPTVTVSANAVSGQQTFKAEPTASSVTDATVPAAVSTAIAAPQEKTDGEAVDLNEGEIGRGTIQSPGDYWNKNGYPDDVSFVHNAGDQDLKNGVRVSRWRIGMVNADNSRKQEILDMFSPECMISFVDCRNSYNQRKTICDEILGMGYDAVQAVGLSPSSENIYVQVSDEFAKEYAAKLIRQYGSYMVITNDLNAVIAAESKIELGGGISTDTDDHSLWIWIAAAVMLLATAGLFFRRTNLTPILQTSAGTTTAPSICISRKQTIDAVKNSEVSPRDELLQSILCKLRKKEQ